MLITSHFAATTLLLLTAKSLNLNFGNEIIAGSFLLGVGIDFDHLVFHGKEMLQFSSESRYLHSFLQEPFSFFVAFGLSFLLFLNFRNLAVFLPASSLGIHVFMDSLMKYENRLLWPFSNKPFKGFIPENTILEFTMGLMLSILLIHFWQFWQT